MIEKFKSKNAENINKLNNYIDNNFENIHKILTSTEMYEMLKNFEHCEIKGENRMVYKGKIVERMPHFKTGYINFVLMNNYIKFNFPCVCGFYDDEEHNSEIR